MDDRVDPSKVSKKATSLSTGAHFKECKMKSTSTLDGVRAIAARCKSICATCSSPQEKVDGNNNRETNRGSAFVAGGTMLLVASALLWMAITTAEPSVPRTAEPRANSFAIILVDESDTSTPSKVPKGRALIQWSPIISWSNKNDALQDVVVVAGQNLIVFCTSMQRLLLCCASLPAINSQ